MFNNKLTYRCSGDRNEIRFRLGVELVILERYAAALRESEAQARGVRWLRGPVYGLCLCAPTLGYAVSLAYGGYLIARDDLPYEYAIL